MVESLFFLPLELVHLCLSRGMYQHGNRMITGVARESPSLRQNKQRPPLVTPGGLFALPRGAESQPTARFNDSPAPLCGVPFSSD